MPTVIILDVSLSMSRGVDIASPCQEDEDVESLLLRKDLAAHGCNILLDHFIQHCKLEFASLIVFSSVHKVLMPFTRDFEAIKNSLNLVEECDKTSIEVGLMGAAQHILEEWGNGTPCQIVLVTDGNAGTGQHTLQKAMMSSHSRGASQFPLPFPFPAKLNIVCITNPNEPCLQISKPLYQRLIELNGEGDILVPEGGLNKKTVTEMFEQLIKNNFSSYSGTLHCGNLSAPITLSPPPQPYCRHHDFEVMRVSVDSAIQVLGFLNTGDVSSPPAFSRHLVLPLSAKGDMVMLPKADPGSDDESSGNDEGKIPSFCVLLHGGLKRENMVALCQVGDNWHGILYSWADNKKKSNLMLSLFVPGVDVIPWMGKLSNLGPASQLPINPYGPSDTSSPFPLKVHEKKSYALNCVVWVRQGGLQSDIQKILRHARKLPDKTQSFYKELNRVRKAALSYGFGELLEGLANVLERECTLLPSTAHPDAAIQLQHAYEALRNHDKKDIRQNVAPLKTTFSGND
ncbi:integrator complex subunit 14-like [Homarus americanus]|uniref:integrator complex subunit 14-like n=1 Tax=Homarus americanus TaxID=6706 RepID=UPI001C476065|nr:integrator complex subunit 14-like [Homarus americanus]